MHITLNRLAATEQQTLQKFIHGWLPLQMRPQVTSTSHDKLCPSCKRQPEDMAHFLSCNHPTQTNLLQPLQLQLQKLHQKHNVPPQLYQLLWQGLMSVLLTHDLENSEEQYQGIHLQIYQEQEWMGWIQLLYGWFTKVWVQAIEATTTNGTNFYTKVTQLCWQCVLTVWKEQNRALHDTSDPYDTSELQAMVQQIFHDATQHPDTEITIRDQTVDTIMSRPIQQITTWVDYGSMHLRDHTKAVATRAKHHTQDIRNFFTCTFIPKPKAASDKNLLRLP